MIFISLFREIGLFIESMVNSKVKTKCHMLNSDAKKREKVKIGSTHNENMIS